LTEETGQVTAVAITGNGSVKTDKAQPLFGHVSPVIAARCNGSRQTKSYGETMTLYLPCARGSINHQDEETVNDRQVFSRRPGRRPAEI